MTVVTMVRAATGTAVAELWRRARAQAKGMPGRIHLGPFQGVRRSKKPHSFAQPGMALRLADELVHALNMIDPALPVDASRIALTVEEARLISLVLYAMTEDQARLRRKLARLRAVVTRQQAAS